MKKISTAASLMFPNRGTLVSWVMSEFPIGLFPSQVNRSSLKMASFGVDIPLSKLSNVQADITVELSGALTLTVYDESKEGQAAVYQKKDRPPLSKEEFCNRIQTFMTDLRNGRLSSAIKGFDRVN